MTEKDLGLLAAELSRKTGLRFVASGGRNHTGEFIDFGFAELDKNEGFVIHVQLGWRSLEISFRPGSYAAQLIAEMGRATSASRNVFALLAKRVLEAGAKLSLFINEISADCLITAAWPVEWHAFSLTLKKAPLDLTNDETSLNAIKGWSDHFMSLVLALLPVENQSVPLPQELVGFPEGAMISVEVNRYERDHRNRTLCLQFKGYKCSVCDFDFQVTYGDIGHDFIHVHHVTPASKLGDGYIIDPINDLVPLCPNCHAMVHKRNPPYSVDEMKALIQIAYGKGKQ